MIGSQKFNGAGCVCAELFSLLHVSQYVLYYTNCISAFWLKLTSALTNWL